MLLTAKTRTPTHAVGPRKGKGQRWQRRPELRRQRPKVRARDELRVLLQALRDGVLEGAGAWPRAQHAPRCVVVRLLVLLLVVLALALLAAAAAAASAHLARQRAQVRLGQANALLVCRLNVLQGALGGGSRRRSSSCCRSLALVVRQLARAQADDLVHGVRARAAAAAAAAAPPSATTTSRCRAPPAPAAARALVSRALALHDCLVVVRPKIKVHICF